MEIHGFKSNPFFLSLIYMEMPAFVSVCQVWSNNLIKKN